MTDTDPDLDRLHDLLSAIPAERDGMTIAELDGYVAALIVCPEMIPPSEWRPGVWGGEHEFGDVAEPVGGQHRSTAPCAGRTSVSA